MDSTHLPSLAITLDAGACAQGFVSYRNCIEVARHVFHVSTNIISPRWYETRMQLACVLFGHYTAAPPPIPKLAPPTPYTLPLTSERHHALYYPRDSSF